MAALDTPAAARRAGAHGRGQPQPPHGDRGRVDAARVRPVEPGSRLRRPGRRAVGGGAVPAVPHRPDGARGQPADRGQPAELPPRDRPRLRPGQRVGHVGQPLDRRGGPPRVLHPRLPPRHPRRRPRRAGAGADGDDGDGLRGAGQVAAQRLRLRLLPGARDPHLAPQHRALHRRADRREAAQPGREGREPPHDLLPQHRHRGAPARPEPDDARDHRGGRRLPDAGQRDPRLLPQGGADGEGRDLRPAHPPRRHRRSPAAPVGGLGPRGPRRGRREGARGARRRGRRPRHRGDPLRRAPRGGRGQEGGAA